MGNRVNRNVINEARWGKMRGDINDQTDLSQHLPRLFRYRKTFEDIQTENSIITISLLDTDKRFSVLQALFKVITPLGFEIEYESEQIVQDWETITISLNNEQEVGKFLNNLTITNNAGAVSSDSNIQTALATSGMLILDTLSASTKLELSLEVTGNNGGMYAEDFRHATKGEFEVEILMYEI